jgi:alkylation response protein AidB-like acyl-CoA dehydrogenase
MNFDWSDEQLELRRSIVEFAQRELNHNVAERDIACEFSRDAWRKCANFGIQSFPIAEAYGGRGLEPLSCFLAMEGLGYGCRDNGLTFSLNAHAVSVVQTLIDAGSDEQKQKYLRGICSGDLIGGYAMTEPESGSDAYSLRTTYSEADNGYVLNGHKAFITFGPVADFFLVFATSNRDLGHWGISLFVVDRDSPGLEIKPNKPKMGLRTAPIGELVLDECRVGPDAIVGNEGSGASIFHAGQDVERAAILASQIGAMEYQIERAVEYAQTREQFGKPIGKFQSVANRIADMKIRLESARLLAYKAVWQIQRGLPASLDAAIAKVTVADAFVKSSLDCILVFGGRGYLTETEIERDLRDAAGGPVYGGTSDIQRIIIARQLGL